MIQGGLYNINSPIKFCSKKPHEYKKGRLDGLKIYLQQIWINMITNLVINSSINSIEDILSQKNNETIHKLLKNILNFQNDSTNN